VVGVHLHVETRGEGPLVVLASGLWSPPGTFDAMLDDLAADHTVLTYDPRGCGQSPAEGPYDLDTDAADVAEAIRAQDAGPAVVIGIGPGSFVGLHLVDQAPELVDAIVCPSGSPVNLVVGEGDDSFAGSSSVFDLLNELAQRDYRAFLRSIVTSTSPQLDDAGVSARIDRVVEYTPHAVMLARLRAWLRDDATALSRAAGDRLWILLNDPDPWSGSSAGAATRELLPEAHVLEVEDGPISRPDIAAGIVRRRTGVAA
jgi:pimeloyl-ACP methyl ester carboxylesterase